MAPATPPTRSLAHHALTQKHKYRHALSSPREQHESACRRLARVIPVRHLLRPPPPVANDPHTSTMKPAAVMHHHNTTSHQSPSLHHRAKTTLPRHHPAFPRQSKPRPHPNAHPTLPPRLLPPSSPPRRRLGCLVRVRLVLLRLLLQS